MIPEHKRAVVERALTETFGITTVDELRPLAGGLSTALVLRALDSAQAKADYALAHLRRANENALSPRLRQALSLLQGCDAELV